MIGNQNYSLGEIALQSSILPNSNLIPYCLVTSNSDNCRAPPLCYSRYQDTKMCLCSSHPSIVELFREKITRGPDTLREENAALLC